MEEKANEHGHDGTPDPTDSAFTGAHHRNLYKGSQVRISQVPTAAYVHDFGADFSDHVLCLVRSGVEFQSVDCRNACLHLPDPKLWNIWGDCGIVVCDRSRIGFRPGSWMAASETR